MLVNCQRERFLGERLTIGSPSVDLDGNSQEDPLGTSLPLPTQRRILIHIGLQKRDPGCPERKETPRVLAGNGFLSGRRGKDGITHIEG
jgi:hypothetical protein